MLISQDMIAKWKPRTQQIFPAESLAVPLVLYLHGELLANREVIWFIDNEAVTAAAIHGTNSRREVSEVLDVAVIAHTHFSARIWFEWIDSRSNPSDDPSRFGLSSPVARRLSQA